MKGKQSQFILFILSLLLFLTIGIGCTKKAEVRQDMAPQQKSVTDDQKAKDEAAAREKALRDQAMKDEADRLKSMKAAETKAEMDTAAMADIHFDFDKYVIRSQDRDILIKATGWIKKNNPKMVIIEGNCDERGSDEYNLALGDRRATETKKYLVTMGVNGGILKTISYGNERPLDPGHNEEAWAKNRRAHFVVN